MPSIRELQGRMKGIQDTKKITNAMYLISSTKLRKARDDMEKAEPHFAVSQSMIARILHHLPEVKSSYISEIELPPPSADGKRRGYLVITADKGLAGSYNHNVLKLAQQQLKNDDNWTLFVVGEVGRQFFRARNQRIEQGFLYSAQNPSLHRARVIAGRLLEMYDEQKLDEIYIVYTRMKSSLAMETKFTRLLPLTQDLFEEPAEGAQNLQELVFSPSPAEALNSIVPNFITGFVYGALVDSFCCEQNARMMAMSAANDNAEEILRDLSVQYNRVRQAIITQEITEVIGGAKALKHSEKGDGYSL